MEREGEKVTLIDLLVENIAREGDDQRLQCYVSDCRREYTASAGRARKAAAVPPTRRTERRLMEAMTIVYCAMPQIVVTSTYHTNTASERKNQEGR